MDNLTRRNDILDPYDANLMESEPPHRYYHP
jgi:hypothetical protein